MERSQGADMRRVEPAHSSRRFLCGIDEAGRGPLAGPVYAAAVVLPDGFPVSLLNDSKKMTEKKRVAAMREIYACADTWGTGCASPAEIDALNILQASLLAMRRAYENAVRRFAGRLHLSQEEIQRRTAVIVDGTSVPKIPCLSCEALVKADSKIHAVMAASILAKTARDRMMIRYSWLYPEYGYEKHKGYPTASHIEALRSAGPSPIQRESFRVKGLRRDFSPDD